MLDLLEPLLPEWANASGSAAATIKRRAKSVIMNDRGGPREDGQGERRREREQIDWGTQGGDRVLICGLIKCCVPMYQENDSIRID